jgi:hypothetical protein
VRSLLQASGRQAAPLEIPDPEPSPQTRDSAMDDLRRRVDLLETMLEGLQDALYRLSQRDDERFQRLRDRTEPDEIARNLSADERRRGL